MTHNTTSTALATPPGVSGRPATLRIRGDLPRCSAATVLIVEYTEMHAGGQRGQVAVMDWIAQHAKLEHVNYGQPKHMTSLVPCKAPVDHDAPRMIRDVMRAARRQQGAYVLFQLVG